MRVVFLDRDGVINRNRADYVKCVNEFEFLPGAVEAISRLHSAGWSIVVVSNQAGVGKGLYGKNALAEIDALMISGVRSAGGDITATYYCTHRPDEKCNCRKPAPGLIFRASQDLGFQPDDAVFVGDAAGDMLAGYSAGCRTVMVLSGRTSALEAKVLDPAPSHIATDLSEAVEWILAGDR